MFEPDEKIMRSLAEEERKRDARRKELEALGASEDEIRDILEPEDQWGKRHPISMGAADHAEKQLASVREFRRWCADETRRQKRAELGKAGAPELHLRHMFDVAPRETDALVAVRTFIRSKDHLLVLSGGVGCGKTAAAIWALSRFCVVQKLRYGESLVSVDARFIRMTELRELLSYDKKERPDVVHGRPRALIVIDDLGAEYRTDWLVAGVEGLIDARYGACVKTIITSNLDAERFKGTYPRAADRVREVGSFVTIGGASLRKRAS